MYEEAKEFELLSQVGTDFDGRFPFPAIWTVPHDSWAEIDKKSMQPTTGNFNGSESYLGVQSIVGKNSVWKFVWSFG